MSKIKGLQNIRTIKNLLALVRQHGTTIEHITEKEEELTFNYDVVFIDGQKFIISEDYHVYFE